MSLVSLQHRLVPFIFAASAFTAIAANALPVHLRTEQMTNPLGIDVAKPVFEWQSDSITPNWMQSAYEVTVATDAASLLNARTAVWDSGPATSPALDSGSILFVYGPMGWRYSPQQRY